MEKRHYEILLILRPTEDGKIIGLVDEYVRILKEDGEIERMEQWGLRRLAYAIKDHRRGFYVLINTCCRSSAIEKLEERFRFEDHILRFMIMRQQKAQTGESPVALSVKNSRDKDADYQKTDTRAPKALPKAAERAEDWSGENVDPDATDITQPKSNDTDTTSDNPKKESEPNPVRQDSKFESPTPEITGETSDASVASVKDSVKDKEETSGQSDKPGNPDNDNQDNTEEEKKK